MTMPHVTDWLVECCIAFYSKFDTDHDGSLEQVSSMHS